MAEYYSTFSLDVLQMFSYITVRAPEAIGMSLIYVYAYIQYNFKNLNPFDIDKSKATLMRNIELYNSLY